MHGSASLPSVFDGWSESFPGVTVVCVDLQAGLDVASARMEDYAQAIVRAAEPLARPLAVCAWSLGGLAAMLAAGRVQPDALVLLEASPPLEVQGMRDGGPHIGTFEASPGAPPAIARRPESLWASGERDRGISVPSLPEKTRTLVAYGDSFRHDRGPVLAKLYGAEQLDAGSATHYDMVLDRELRERVAEWLRATLPL